MTKLSGNTAVNRCGGKTDRNKNKHFSRRGSQNRNKGKQRPKSSLEYCWRCNLPRSPELLETKLKSKIIMRSHTRPPPKPHDAGKEDLIFQQIDIDHYIGKPFPGMPGAQSGSVPVMRMFGVTKAVSNARSNLWKRDWSAILSKNARA